MSQISGPAGAAFGRDPLTFAINVCKRAPADLAKLTKRCANRTGIKTWVTQPKNGRSFQASMIASASDKPEQIALVICLWAIKRPDILVDEAGRQAFNIHEGPKSLDGVQTLSTQGWPQAWGGGGGTEEGEPFTIAAILTIAVPIIVAIAPVVLPMIMNLVGSTLKSILPQPEVAPAPVKPAEFFGIPANMILLGAAAVAAFVLLKH